LDLQSVVYENIGASLPASEITERDTKPPEYEPSRQQQNAAGHLTPQDRMNGDNPILRPFQGFGRNAFPMANNWRERRRDASRRPCQIRDERDRPKQKADTGEGSDK
jgi:hypothetical protein